MKKFVLGIVFGLTVFSAQALELETKRYEGREVRSLLLSAATNLEDVNCVRKIMNSHLHAAEIAMGCHIQSINVLEDRKDSKKLHVGPQYYCPELNMASATSYTCYKK